MDLGSWELLVLTWFEGIRKGKSTWHSHLSLHCNAAFWHRWRLWHASFHTNNVIWILLTGDNDTRTLGTKGTFLKWGLSSGKKQGKPSYLWPSNFSLFSPLWLWDCCCCLVTESSPTLCNPMDWTCQISLSLTISWSLPKFDYGIASKKWISLRIKASFLKQPHCCCRTPLWAQN